MAFGAIRFYGVDYLVGDGFGGQGKWHGDAFFLQAFFHFTVSVFVKTVFYGDIFFV